MTCPILYIKYKIYPGGNRVKNKEKNIILKKFDKRIPKKGRKDQSKVWNFNRYDLSKTMNMQHKTIHDYRDVNDHKWWGFDIELIQYRTEMETFGAVCVLIE